MCTRTIRHHAVSLLSLWLGVLVIGTQPGCAPDVSDLRTEGIEQYRRREFIQSMATFREVLGKAPNDAQANYYMGLNYRTMAARKFRDQDYVAAYRELDTAIIYFTQAIKSWPNYMEAVASKNEALEARGKYAEALRLAERVAENNRGSASEHFVYLGNEYRERGDYDSALRSYKTALSTDPDNAAAYAAIGALYEEVGDRQLARDAYTHAQELDPSTEGVAEALARLGGPDKVHTASGTSEP
jgi:tetratricopeptide (TPR) repeat protein